MTQVLAHEQVLAVHTSLEVLQGRSLVIQVRSLGSTSYNSWQLKFEFWVVVQVRSHGATS